jgi:ABC-2 type transport system permease protein
MSETLIVLRREFIERVRTKGFWIGTVLFPVLLVGFNLLPVLMRGDQGGTRRLVVVDEAPAGVAGAFAARLQAPAADREGRIYQVETVPGPLDDALRGRLNARIADKSVYGYVHFPADVLASSRADLRARNVSNVAVLGDLRRAASEAVQGERLRAAGLDVARVDALVRRVELNTVRVSSDGQEGGSTLGLMLLGFVMPYVMMLMIMIYGINVMRSVLEEKTARIAEVIVSSMKASHLMLGKILGVGAVALLQVGIWVAVMAVAVSQSDALASRLGVPANVFAALELRPGAVAAILVFFVLGFLLYSAIYAAVGAAVNSDQEAQQAQTFVTLALIVPMGFITVVQNDPMGSTATLLGMIPFTAPVANVMRIALTEVPLTQLLASMGVLAATVVATAWVAGKIYRVGILSTGKKPTLAELGRWLRAA